MENIRIATADDIGRIAEILVFTKRVKFRSIFNNDEFLFNHLQVTKVVEEINRRTVTNTLVYDDGIIKGILHYDNKSLEFNEICELYVDVCFERNGIGRKLVEYFEGQCKERSIHCVELWSIEKNVVANTFYETLGYAKTGAKQLIEGTNEYQIRYRKNLSV